MCDVMAAVMTIIATVNAACGYLNTAFDCIRKCCGQTNTESDPQGNNQSTRDGDAIANNHHLSGNQVENTTNNQSVGNTTTTSNTQSSGNNQHIVINIPGPPAAAPPAAAPPASSEMVSVDPVTGSNTYVGPWGNPHYGNPFAHDNFDGIKAIKISSGRLIESIEVRYIRGGNYEWTRREGGGDPKEPPKISETMELEDEEYITEVEGYYGTAASFGRKLICYLSFFTNKRRPLGTYGTHYDSENLTGITPFRVKGGKIVGFHGSASKTFIYSIGFYLSRI